MANFRFTIKGLDKFEKFTKKAMEFLQGDQRFFEQAARIGKADVLNHFRNSQGRTGKWKPLKYREGKPLIKTGALVGSLQMSWDKKEARVGTNIIYGAVHDYGYPPRNIPQREYLHLLDLAQRRITETFIKMMEGIK
jgi:phage gpG-like protein